MSTDEPLDVGVVGVGAMGQHHARVYSNLSEATLVGVADTDDGRANEIATRYATKHYGVDELIERGHGELETEEVAPEDRAFRVSFDMMYDGQAHYLNVPYAGESVDGSDLDDIAAAFERAHEDQYGFVDERNPIELVNLRVTAVGATPDPTMDPAGTTSGTDPADARVGTREGVLDRDERVETPYYDPDGLHPGHELTGPAVVEQENTTIRLPPTFDGEIDPYGNLVATRRDST